MRLWYPRHVLHPYYIDFWWLRLISRYPILHPNTKPGQLCVFCKNKKIYSLWCQMKQNLGSFLFLCQCNYYCLVTSICTSFWYFLCAVSLSFSANPTLFFISSTSFWSFILSSFKCSKSTSIAAFLCPSSANSFSSFDLTCSWLNYKTKHKI